MQYYNILSVKFNDKKYCLSFTCFGEIKLKKLMCLMLFKMLQVKLFFLILFKMHEL